MIGGNELNKLILLLSALLIITSVSGIVAAVGISGGTAKNFTNDQLTWSGYTWIYDNAQGTYIKTDPSHAWVDDKGYLHMYLSYLGGSSWMGCNMNTANSYRYGKFIYKTVGQTMNFPTGVTLGMYTYYNDSNELDIEVESDDSIHHVSYTVQPGNTGQCYLDVANGSPYLTTNNLTYVIDWKPTSVAFSVLTESGTIISSWTYSDASKISSCAQNAMLGFISPMWDCAEVSPSDTSNKEVVLKSFQYIPYNAPKPPVSAFYATKTSGKSPLAVKFIDKSTNNPTSWSWSFGDGSTSNVQNPVHIYTKKGTYTVTLKVTNSAGSNTLTKSRYIKIK